MGIAVFEVFDFIEKLATEGEKVAALQQAPNQTRLHDILYYGMSSNIKFDLPEGDPPFRANHDVNTQGNFWADARRLYLFSKKSRPMDEGRRQHLFIGMLEFLHPSDAQLLLAIKDGKWPYDTITTEVVEQAFPGLLAKQVQEGGNRV